MFGSTTPLQNVPSRRLHTFAWCTALLAIPLVLACTAATPDTTVDATESDEGAVAADAVATLGSSRNIMVVFSSCPVPDPAIDESYASRGIDRHSLVTEIHAGLTRIDENAGNEVEPELAESYTVRDDGKEYEFTLRKGLKFSDGSELTAEDIKWSWERSLMLSRDWTHARDAFGTIVGAEEIIQGNSDGLTGLKVVDDSTLIVKLTEPMPLFPMLISVPAAAVLKRENARDWPVRWTNGNLVKSASPPIDYDYHEFGTSEFTTESMPVGAGPFKLDIYRADDVFADCVISRNEHYWGRPAKLDAVVFSGEPSGGDGLKSVGPTDFTRWFVNGAIDIAPATSDLRTAIQAQKLEGVNTQTESNPYTYFLAFNPSVPPMDDFHFRRAMVLAADRNALFSGNTSPEPVIVPPRLVDYERNVNGTVADVTIAKSEIGKSQYALSLPEVHLTMYTDQAQGYDYVLDDLFAQWSDELGFRAELKRISTFEETLSMRDGAQIPFRAILVSPIYPDPYAVLRVFDGVFGSGGGKSANDDEVVKLLRRAKTEGDPRVRRTLYDQLEQRLIDEALALPLYVDRHDFEIMLQPWVHDFNLKRFGGSVFHDVWFDDTAPERPLP